MMIHTTILLCLLLHTANCIVEHFFVRIGDDNHAYPGGPVVPPMMVSSQLECSMACLRLLTCVSFNVNTQREGGIMCRLLSSRPLNPETELIPIAGALYYEKTCQVLLNPVAVSEEWDGTHYVENTALITGEGRETLYRLTLYPDYSIDVLQKLGGLSELTSGEIETTIGQATVKFDSVELMIYLVEDGVMCFKVDLYSGESGLPCFSEPVVSKTSLFGTEDVNALLPTESFKRLYAFGYDKVRIVEVDEFDPWIVTDTIDLTSNSRPPGWANVPKGVVGAAWLVEYDGAALELEKAFFLTPHYYAVYDFDKGENLNRGQLCPDAISDIQTA